MRCCIPLATIIVRHIERNLNTAAAAAALA